MEFSLSREMGPKWIMLLAAAGLAISFALGLSNSTVFFETLPKEQNADILVFYQPTCPHCIAEIPTIKKLVAAGYSVSAFNVFKYPRLAEKYHVTATPTIVITRTGEKLEGEQPYTAIISAIHGLSGTWAQNGEACGIGVNTCSRT
ncbi:MAG: thioredoxin family protein [Candidatus Diapherotrites archaeon]|nr:thioredoxin family protein [Candidatus Diapherotrites archaeon]